MKTPTAGKHIYCEKPVSVTLAEATRVMDALRPNLIVGHVTDPDALRRAAPADIPVVILDDALSAPDSMIAEIRRALRKRATE